MNIRRIFLILIGAIMLLVMSSSQPPGRTAYAANVQQATAPGVEYWRAGHTVEGGLNGGSIAGRILDPVASFRSNRGVNDIYFYLAAPSHTTWVKEASFYILDCTGTFTEVANMTLEILSLEGILQHQVSEAEYNFTTWPTGNWNSITLNTEQDHTQIDPGEMLAFHVQFQPSYSGDLALHSLFEVKVSQYRYLYLPVVTN